MTEDSNQESPFNQISSIGASMPDSIALRQGAKVLTYGELDQRSGRFCGYLLTLGIRPGENIAICMERSFDWIVASLGAIRAGLAYVPLDPDWAPDRIRYAIKDSGAKLLVAQTELLNQVQHGIRGIDPIRDLEALDEAEYVEKWSTEPGSLAYVIYTSGSSGVPKGVEITHASLSNLIQWHHSTFSITAKDVTSHIAGLGFDAAVWELWPALTRGAIVSLVNDSIRSSSDLLSDWIVQEGITVSYVPTVLATSMISRSWPENTQLRVLLTGGDTLAHGPIAGLPFKVVNNYGPTECTVVATSGIVEPGLKLTPSIGRPIRGATIHILDESSNPVPDGVEGELYIGGRVVGRGYHNLPVLTELSFLHVPCEADFDGRVYRTGDLGVRLASGEIEFRGRVDRQIKLRGQRIELDEIGSVLGRHDDLDFATVLVTESQVNDKQLVAYVLPKPDRPTPKVADLQAFLLESLPGYMIPPVFVRLKMIPLTSNGKIDFVRLELSSHESLMEGVPGRPPANPIEEKVLEMIQNLLDSQTVSLEDNFFLIGGHSLIGMQLVMRLRANFGVDFTLRQLFDAPTVEQLALAVETMLIESVESMTDEEANR